jgi:hypothetical protein
LVHAEDYGAVEAGDRLEIPDLRRHLERDTRFGILNRTRGTTIEVDCSLTERQRRIVLDGGALSAAQGRGD